jgi:hypothetical protein
MAAELIGFLPYLESLPIEQKNYGKISITLTPDSVAKLRLQRERLRLSVSYDYGQGVIATSLTQKMRLTKPLTVLFKVAPQTLWKGLWYDSIKM